MVLKGSIRTKLLDNQNYRRCHHLLLPHKRLVIGILGQPLQGNDSTGCNHIILTRLKRLLPVLISPSPLMHLTQNYHPFTICIQFCMFGNIQLERKECEDTGKGQSYKNQGKRPQKKSTILRPQYQTSSF